MELLEELVDERDATEMSKLRSGELGRDTPCTASLEHNGITTSSVPVQ